ncbi:MAG: agmatine deiminase family protein, partial [Gemmataceae bacterium]|nr:agmatine deiminase family protein [Gemmataceae bacterium]
GILLTTEECLLSDVQCRNPAMSRGDYEAVFRKYLGIERTIWLHKGIVGDDTHGHVDDLARFVSESTVLLASEADGADENFELLRENRERLMAEPGITVVDLPMPAPVIFRKQRLPASYANFYIGNEVVLVPTFNDENDRHALGIIADLFPGRRVIGIHSVDLVWGLGTLHCLSQQLVAATGR